MVVQHNMQAMNAGRMLGVTTGLQAKATEKLSSGCKINRAADDAVGFTISEKMRKQVKGLTCASTNAQDGISCVQTAEGALTEVHAMLQRMNELAVQSANGTNSDTTDRKAIQDEINQLVTEIDRVSETTKFNKTYLLKGAPAKTKTETTEVAKVAYKDTISLEKKLEFVAGGTSIWATKDGESFEITDDETLNKAFEIGTVTKNKPRETADEVAAADYTVVDVTKTDADGFLGAATPANDKVEKDITYTWNSTAGTFSNDLDATTITKADLETKLGVTYIYAADGTTAMSDLEIVKAVVAGDKLYKTAATRRMTRSQVRPIFRQLHGCLRSAVGQRWKCC